jgi:hypothetical protein
MFASDRATGARRFSGLLSLVPFPQCHRVPRCGQACDLPLRPSHGPPTNHQAAETSENERKKSPRQRGDQFVAFGLMPDKPRGIGGIGGIGGGRLDCLLSLRRARSPEGSRQNGYVGVEVLARGRPRAGHSGPSRATAAAVPKRARLSAPCLPVIGVRVLPKPCRPTRAQRSQ